VIASPGHTPGHVAFLDPRDGTLLCGDVYTTIGGVATTTGRNLRFPLAIPATWHGPTELGSARALRALRPRRLAPGHGKIVEAPEAAMDAAITRAS
jgi:glyoxylase-like metal-dependent hydrolase (beta-lactamase superfamily II)